LLLITSLCWSVYWRGHSSANPINHHFAFLPSLSAFLGAAGVVMRVMEEEVKKK
jgi:hypothetical protein